MNLDSKVAELKNELISSVQDIVKIKSVEEEGNEKYPFGQGVQKTLEYSLNLANNLGFKTKNVDNMIGYAEYGQGEELIAVLGHLDVVPEGDGWTYPPYGGEIHDGKIYGRGTTDDKGPTMAALYALKAIKDLNLPLKRRVRIIFGLNEETGSNCVKHYIKAGEDLPIAGFTPDAEYPIINGEKGIVTCRYKKTLKDHEISFIKSIKGGIAPNVVPDYAEAVLVIPEDLKNQVKKLAEKEEKITIEFHENEVIIRALGISAHGSTPEKGENAIGNIFRFLSKLGVTGSSKELIDFINQYIAMDTTGKLLGIDLSDEVSGDFTLNLGVINGDKDEVYIDINMRYPVTKTYEDFIDIFEEKMKLGGFEEVHTKHKNSLYVSPDTDFIKKLQKVYEEKVGDKAELISIGGGTYAKAMKNIVAFGPIFKGEPMVEHKPDEYISIDSLMKNTEIIAAAIYELAK